MFYHFKSNGPYLDVDSIKHIVLGPTSNFANNTRIHVVGNDDYGEISLNNAYEGTIEIEYNGNSSSRMVISAPLNDKNKIVFNAPNNGKMNLYALAKIEGAMTINNNSSLIQQSNISSRMH